jgi:hypothetical protein
MIVARSLRHIPYRGSYTQDTPLVVRAEREKDWQIANIKNPARGS